MIHRLVAEYFVDGYFEGAVVNHKDGNTLNNHYTNLEWMSQKDNIKDGNRRNNTTSTKWCYEWQIIYPNGQISKKLYGKQQVKKYITDNNLKCKFTMLLKHKSNNNYKLIKVI